jgi:hypothetical protein
VRFVTHHHPGALASAIQPLAAYGVNMTSLQSRPITRSENRPEQIAKIRWQNGQCRTRFARPHNELASGEGGCRAGIVEGVARHSHL